MKSAKSIVWMIVGAILVFVFNDVQLLLTEDLEGIGALLVTAGVCLVGMILYGVVMRFLVRRSMPELSGRRAGTEVVWGALTGVSFIAVSLSVIAALGGYSFQLIADAATTEIVLSAITASLVAAVMEELIFRGFLFQAFERMGGQWVAIAITSLMFGGAHLGNPGATLWGAFAIAVEAGILFGAVFLWRRNLWYAIGLHFAWDVMAGLMGLPLAGHELGGLVSLEVKGPELLTGGEFGMEGSIVVVVLGLLISIPMLIAVARKRVQANVE